MKRVCIIGNSHLGAYKLALDGGDIPGVSDRFSFDTFGSIRASLTQTRISDARLIPTRKDVSENFARTSGGQTEIRLGEYAVFIMAIRNSPFWIRPYLFDTELAPISDSLIAEIHRDFLDDWSIKLASEIAQAVPSANVLFVGRPLNSERDFLARRLKPQLEGDGGAAATAIKDQILLRLNEVTRAIPVAANVSFVRPPDHLLESHRLFTRARYARGAEKAEIGLKQVFKADDTQHMNGDYGREMLAHMLAAA